MADVTFTIAFRDDGTPVVKNFKREVEGLGDAGKRAGDKASAMDRAFGALRGTLAALGVTLATQQLLSMVDAATRLEGQLRLVTHSSEQLADVQTKLFQIAQSTSASYESVILTYTRAARAQSTLRVTGSELLKITGAIGNALRISNATSAEASAAMLQLSQAFQSGVLQGDEFRSLSEQMPILLTLVAKEMGKTREELKKLGADGKITGVVLAQSLIKNFDMLQSQAAKLPTTMGQAVTQLGNSILQMVGSFDKMTGGSKLAASAISALARNLDIAAVALGTFAAVGIVANFTAITAAATKLGFSIAALNVLLLANPWVAVAAGVALAAAGLVKLALYLSSIAPKGHIAQQTFDRYNESLYGNMKASTGAAKAGKELLAAIKDAEVSAASFNIRIAQLTGNVELFRQASLAAISADFAPRLAAAAGNAEQLAAVEAEKGTATKKLVIDETAFYITKKQEELLVALSVEQGKAAAVEAGLTSQRAILVATQQRIQVESDLAAQSTEKTARYLVLQQQSVDITQKIATLDAQTAAAANTATQRRIALATGLINVLQTQLVQQQQLAQGGDTAALANAAQLQKSLQGLIAERDKDIAAAGKQAGEHTAAMKTIETGSIKAAQVMGAAFVAAYDKMTEATKRRIALQAAAFAAEAAALSKQTSQTNAALTVLQSQLKVLQARGATYAAQFILVKKIGDQEQQLAQLALQRAEDERDAAKISVANAELLSAQLRAQIELGKQQGDDISVLAQRYTELEKARLDAWAQVEEAEGKVAEATADITVAATEANERIRDLNKINLDRALLTLTDLRDGFRDVIRGTFEGSGGIEDAAIRFGEGLGLKLIEGIALGKGNLEDQVLIPNFRDMFGQNGIVGGILGKSGLNLGSLFGDAFSQGVSGSGGNAGSLFGSGMMEMLGGTGTAASGMAAAGSTAGSTWGSAFVKVGGGILSKFLGGGSGSGASMGGGLLTLGGGILGNWAGGKFAGMAGLTDSKEGKMGGNIGGAAGAIGGGILGMTYLGAQFGSFAGPIGAAVGAIIGVLLGAFAGDLFKPTTTSGTLIRKGIKDYFKEIKVSFAKEVDSGNYFFEETKKLADQMFGGDFLAASKEILTTKAGPDLAKQLQALGTVLTADSAMDLGKSVEQTGTTFGNLLVANLGIDAIPDAITEIVQKSKLSFEGLTGTLTEVFDKKKIDVEFYKDAIQGAVDIFFGDLPAAIHVSEIAMRSFTDAGIFDLEKFQKDLEQAVERMNIVGSGMGQALADGIESGQSRAEVEASFENLVKSALREQIVTKYVSDIIAKGFAGFDFSKPIDMSSDAMARLKSLVGDSYDDLVLLLKTAGLLPEALEKSVDSADSLLDRIRELRATIQDLVTQRIEIRLQLLDDFVTIGLTTALDAIATRIQSIQDRISALLESAGQGHIGTQPFSELSDTDLTQIIQLQEQLRNAILSRYQEEAAAIQAAAQAQIAAIREEYAAKRASIQAEFAARREALQVEFAAKRASIQAEFEARRTAIQAEFEARRTAIQATIKKLEEQRTATEKLFQAQIEAVQVQIEAEQEHIQALQEQLQIAEQFGQVVASITDIIRSAMLSAQTPLAPQQQLGFLQREESGLRSQLATATGAERARLIQELAQVLQQQLQFVDRNTVNGQQLFTNIITELSALRAAAAKEADKAAGLRSQIAAATVHIELLTERIAAINEKMEEAVKKIDAQIEHQQELLSALSAQEQALLTTLSTQEQAALEALSAQEQAALEALSAQEQAQLATLAAQEEAAIHAVEATAAAQLTALRTETAQQLTALAIQQDLLVQEQLRRAEAQLETAKEQLVAQVGAEEAARLLAAGDQAQLIVMTQMNTLLFNIDQHIVDLLNKSSQEETQTQAPSTQQQLSSANSRDTTAAPPLSLNFTFSPVVTMSMQGSEEQQMPSAQLKAGMENTLRLAEQRVKRLIETDWAPTIKRAAEGKI